MRDIKSIAGLRVISVDEGASLGAVSQVVVDLAHGKMLGILIDSGPTERGVLAADIQTIGNDVVMVSSRSVAKHLSELPELEHYRRPAGVGMPQVFTSSGKRLGVVSSVFIDPLEKAVTHYEVSAGPLRDVTEGVLVLPIIEGTVHGEDALIVPDAAISDVGRETGGLFAKLSEWGTTVRTGYQHTAENVERIYEKSAEKLKEEGATVKQKAGELAGRAREEATEVKEKVSRLVEGEEAEGEGAIVPAPEGPDEIVAYEEQPDDLVVSPAEQAVEPPAEEAPEETPVVEEPPAEVESEPEKSES